MDDFQNFYNRLDENLQGTQVAEQDLQASVMKDKTENEEISQTIESVTLPILGDDIKDVVRQPLSYVGTKIGEKIKGKVDEAKESVRSKINKGVEELKNKINSKLIDNDVDALPESTVGESNIRKGLRNYYQSRGMSLSDEEIASREANLKNPELFRQKWKKRGDKFNDMSDSEIEQKRQNALDKLNSSANPSESVPQPIASETEDAVPTRGPMTSDELAEEMMASIRGEGRVIGVVRPQGNVLSEEDAGKSAIGAGIKDEEMTSNVTDKIGKQTSKSLEKNIGKDAEKSVADGLDEATEDSVAEDEDPLGWIVTGALGLGALFASFGELFHHHHHETPDISNPSYQYGIGSS